MSIDLQREEWDFELGIHIVRGLFDARQCSQIIELHKTVKLEEVRWKPGRKPYRYTDVYRLKQGVPEYQWIYDIVTDATLKFNAARYRFDLEACAPLQLGRYAKGGLYNWHTDIGSKAMSGRKLSLACALSSTRDFKGGLFQSANGEIVKSHPMEQGDCCFFPSWKSHRVTTVTRGARWSLVTWWGGQPLR